MDDTSCYSKVAILAFLRQTGPFSFFLSQKSSKITMCSRGHPVQYHTFSRLEHIQSTAEELDLRAHAKIPPHTYTENLGSNTAARV